jgi:hypothetical protein
MQNLATLAHIQGDYSRARSFIEESLTIEREIGDKQSIAESLSKLANLDKDEGRFAEAQARYVECFEISRELGFKVGCATAIAGLSAVAFAQRQFARGARLQAAAVPLRLEANWMPDPKFFESYDNQIRQGRAALGEEAFAAAWAEGEAMNQDEAIAYGRSEESGGS